jgi:hypothetical protein
VLDRRVAGRIGRPFGLGQAAVDLPYVVLLHLGEFVVEVVVQVTDGV